MMKKGKKLYEGKAKIIYETNENGLVIQHFKDDATAFNALKKANIEGKGVLNNRISEYLLNSLTQCGIQTHLIKRLNMREQLIKEVKIVQNYAKKCFTENLNLFNVISNDKFIMTKISSKKLKAIFNYSSHFKNVDLIFKRVFK